MAKKMDKNPKHALIKEENRIQILRSLFTEGLKLEDLTKQLSQKTPPIKRSTLFKYLTTMEKEGLIECVSQKEDRRKRIYKITPSGSSLLNEMDTETRDNLFTMNLFMSIESDINLWDMYEQSRQLNQEATQEENEKERSLYIDTILKNIGSVVMYSAMKNMESKDFENQPKLNLLPPVIASRLKTIGLKPDYIRSVFKNRSDQGRFDNLDAYYQMSREITPENYKELMKFYRALQGMDTVQIVTKKQKHEK